MARDELFRKEGDGPPEFQFNERVAEVFDDMLSRSVPGYAQAIAMSAQLLARFLKPGDRLYDLGCSTGNTLLELARQLPEPELRFIGLDLSPAMIDKASRKAALYSPGQRLRFEQADITSRPLKQAGAVLLNYTLQFLRPLERPPLLQRIHQALRPGGVLILSEKVLTPDPGLNLAYSEIYLDFKRARGYSEIEITRKREALENVLVPFSIAENRTLLEEAGFRKAETFCQWFNFVSWVAVK